MIQHPTLETRRLTLRPWTRADRGAFAAINADPRVVEFLPSALSRLASDAVAERIALHFDEHGFGLWAAEEKGGAPFIGFVGLSVPSFEARFTPCVEIAWRLAPAAWGKGYATEAARAALRFGFETRSLAEIVSFTVPANARSRAVMERLGFTRDAAGDFDHPSLPTGHPLRAHVLYRLSARAWRSQDPAENARIEEGVRSA